MSVLIRRLKLAGRSGSKIVRLYRRQGGVCPWCWKPIDREEILTATIDHIIPKSHGGPGTDINSQLLHEKCNAEKGDSCSGCDYCTKGDA